MASVVTLLMGHYQGPFLSLYPDPRQWGGTSCRFSWTLSLRWSPVVPSYLSRSSPLPSHLRGLPVSNYWIRDPLDWNLLPPFTPYHMPRDHKCSPRWCSNWDSPKGITLPSLPNSRSLSNLGKQGFTPIMDKILAPGPRTSVGLGQDQPRGQPPDPSFSHPRTLIDSLITANLQVDRQPKHRSLTHALTTNLHH